MKFQVGPVFSGQVTLALPPLHILSTLMGGWRWLSHNAHNVYTFAGAKGDLESALSRTEDQAVIAIKRQGGVATAAEITKFIRSEQSITHIAVSLLLATSPVIRKLEHSIYAVGGRDIDPLAWQNARTRRAAEQGRYSSAGPIDTTAPIAVTVTQSGSSERPSKRVVYLPAYLTGIVVGEFRDASGTHPPITVRQNNQVRTLSGIAESIGIAKGAQFEIEFSLQTRTYRIAR